MKNHIKLPADLKIISNHHTGMIEVVTYRVKSTTF